MRTGEGWTMRTKLPLPTKRGLSRQEAAEYTGVSPSSFDTLVRSKHFPPPMDMPGVRRKIWDRLALDRVMDAPDPANDHQDLADKL